MSTNYYLHGSACAHCGHEQPPLHLGKSSMGWCFSLHVHPKLSMMNWEDMWNYISHCTDNNYQIKNEYGDVVSPAEFFSIVWDRGRAEPHSLQWLKNNHAIPGPFGLARHIVDGNRCIGNAGLNAPIDYFVGEFS